MAVARVSCGTQQSGQGPASTGGGPPASGGGPGGTGDGGGGSGDSPDAGNAGGSAGTPDAGAAGPADGGTGSILPRQLTTGQAAMYLALDDQNIYWANSQNSGGWRYWHYKVQAMPKTGGAPIAIAEGAGNMLTELIARDGFVYWSMATCPVDCDTFNFKTYIHRVPRDGGGVQELRAETNLNQLSVDDQRVYYRASYGLATDRPGIWSIRLDGTDPRQLTTHPAGTGPVLIGSTLYYMDRGDGPNATFWSSLRALPTSGGTPTELRTETNTLIVPNWIVLHQGTVFASAQVLDSLAGQDMMQAGAMQPGIWRLPLDGSKWNKLWSGPRFHLTDANGGRVYWVQTVDDHHRCFGSGNPDGTDGRCIDEGDHQYRTARVDDTNVFFIRDGDVFSMPR